MPGNKVPILILESYCDNDKCTKNAPCIECLLKCNIAYVNTRTRIDLGEMYKFARGI